MPRRLVAALCLLSLAAAYLLSGAFVMDKILKPSALALWILLRISVLRLDQRLLWNVMCFGVVLLFVFRFARPAAPSEILEPKEFGDSFRSLSLWRLRISTPSSRPDDTRQIRQELAQLLVALYASRKRVPVDYRILEAFMAREIALPEAVRSFLFPEAEMASWPGRLWPHRGRGRRDIEGHYRAIETCLDFLECYAEAKDERHVD